VWPQRETFFIFRLGELLKMLRVRKTPAESSSGSGSFGRIFPSRHWY
jgi:hypothetical protein